MTTPRELKLLFEQGTNISALLRKEQGVEHNSNEIIEIAYDLQTGSYIAAMDNAEWAEFIRDYPAEIARVILSLCEPTSILEAGIGEGTTLGSVLKHLPVNVRSYGFDLSWSRAAYAQRWLQGRGVADATICTGNLLQIPFADNSIELVYTSHSIESNGGNEGPILRELYRVTEKYLILLEPGYELADEESRRRMDSHGYCKNLRGVAESLGYDILKHELFPFTSNPLNPTAITIIKKKGNAIPASHILACPKFKTPLEQIGDMMFSAEALVVYPIVGGIPALRIENGIFASKYREVMAAG